MEWLKTTLEPKFSASCVFEQAQMKKIINTAMDHAEIIISSKYYRARKKTFIKLKDEFSKQNQ